MSIPFECPNCQARYEVADGMAGKTMLCRTCEQRVQVQDPNAAPGPRTGVAAPETCNLTRRKALKIGLVWAVPMTFWGVIAYYWQGSQPAAKSRRPPPDAPADNGAGGDNPGGGNPGGRPGPGGRGGGGRKRRGGGGAPPGPVQ